MTESRPELPKPPPELDRWAYGYGYNNFYDIVRSYGAQCFAAGVAQGLYQAANISALYSSGLERLHPDIPWDEMNEETKRIAHWTAQNIAAAIDSAIRKGK